MGDLAEERFEKSGKKISDNFFVRKDGTRAYYFSQGKNDLVSTQEKKKCWKYFRQTAMKLFRMSM